MRAAKQGGWILGHMRSEMVFQPGQRAGQPEPGAGGDKEDGSAVGDAQAGAAHPAPAEHEPRGEQDETADDEDGKEGVGQRDEVGQNNPHASRSRGNGSQESAGRRRALYSQKETGRPCVSRRWWQQAEIRSWS